MPGHAPCFRKRRRFTRKRRSLRSRLLWGRRISQRRALARHGGLGMRRLLVLFGGVDDHLPLLANAFAGGAHPKLLFEHEGNGAALTRTHWVEAKWLASFANAVGRDP